MEADITMAQLSERLTPDSGSSHSDLRIELRTRNNMLWHLIHDTSDSVAAFCRQHGLHQSEVGGFLNLTRSPYRADGNPRPIAQRLADSAKMLVEDLFPKDLYCGRFPRIMAAEVPSRAFCGLAAAGRIALPPAQEDVLINDEIHDGIEQVLHTLNPREAKCLRLRFGLGNNDEHTLDEVGNELGVTRERARMIEAKALRKLRHPSRATRLGKMYIKERNKDPESLPAMDVTDYRYEDTAPVVAIDSAPPLVSERPPSVYISRDAVASVGQDEIDEILRYGEALLRSLRDT